MSHSAVIEHLLKIIKTVSWIYYIPLVTKVIYAVTFPPLGLCVKGRLLFIPFGSHYLGGESMMGSMIGSRIIT